MINEDMRKHFTDFQCKVIETLEKFGFKHQIATTWRDRENDLSFNVAESEDLNTFFLQTFRVGVTSKEKEIKKALGL